MGKEVGGGRSEEGRVGGGDTRDRGDWGGRRVGRVEEEGRAMREEAGEGIPGVWGGGPWKGRGTQAGGS